MQEAMRLYRLGATDDGGVIFWMIDAQQRVLDGKIMFYLPDCHRDHSRHPSTASSRLIRRGMIPADWQRSTCLFGLHLLAATSPALHADRITAPLFVAQGANDPRVNKAESDQMVEALRSRGVEVEYMVKDDEGHGFHNEENRFDFYRAMERFLARHIGAER